MNNLTIENLSPMLEPVSPEVPRNLSRETREALQENPLAGEGAAIKGPAGDSKTFADALVESVSKVNEMQKHADVAIKELVAGRTKNVHETMLAIERADIAMKLMMQVRNKAIDAYREIMRMQI